MSEASLIELERFRGVPVELFLLKPIRSGRLRRLTMPPSFNAATTKNGHAKARHFTFAAHGYLFDQPLCAPDAPVHRSHIHGRRHFVVQGAFEGLRASASAKSCCVIITEETRPFRANPSKALPRIVRVGPASGPEGPPGVPTYILGALSQGGKHASDVPTKVTWEDTGPGPI